MQCLMVTGATTFNILVIKLLVIISDKVMLGYHCIKSTSVLIEVKFYVLKIT